ncbi:MAG: hypothetical protein QW156_03820 [Candidatus Aenigmatarchaeota archaeon]
MKITNSLTYKTSGSAVPGKLYLTSAPNNIGSVKARIGSYEVVTHSYGFFYNPSGTIYNQWFETNYNTNFFQVYTPQQLAYTSVSFPKFFKRFMIVGGFYTGYTISDPWEGTKCNIIVKYNGSTYQEAKASYATMTSIIVENSGTIEVALDGNFPPNEGNKIFTFMATPLVGSINCFRLPIKSIKNRGYNNVINTKVTPRTWLEEIVLG